jgi:hypothetical protein
MLVYISVYVLAAILLFQGVNLLGEQSSPTNVVPAEVRPAPALASRWGGYLVTFGALMAAAGILSHAYPSLVISLVPLRTLGVASLAAYGLWLVFGRKIDYTPAAPAQEAHGHGH